MHLWVLMTAKGCVEPLSAIHAAALESKGLLVYVNNRGFAMDLLSAFSAQGGICRGMPGIFPIAGFPLPPHRLEICCGIDAPLQQQVNTGRRRNTKFDKKYFKVL